VATKARPKPARDLPAIAPDAFAAMIASEEKEQRLKALSWLQTMINRADGGNADALAHVKAAYKAVPSLVPMVGMLQHNAEQSILTGLLGDRQPYARMVIERQLDELKSELIGEHPSALERILAERVALCWLDALVADAEAAHRLQGSLPLAQAEYWQKRTERAQKNFLRAAKMLAVVRRLGVSAVQINVAEQQVNVAAG
jgi:hypothetical protein